MTEEFIKSLAENLITARYTFYFVNGKDLTVEAERVVFQSDERIYVIYSGNGKRYEINFDKVLYVKTKVDNENKNA